MPAETANTPDAQAADLLKSAEGWMSTPQFRDMMTDEFPEDAAEWLDPVSRRRFLATSAATAALAAAIGCNPSIKPASRRTVLPYVRQPEQVQPNVPLFFATAMPQQGGVGLGLIVKSHEGRPVKAEGNPNQPTSGGAINLPALASMLDLYDPDRSKSVVTGAKAGDGRANVPGSLDKVFADVRGVLRRATGPRGEGVRIVTEPTTSPTVARLMEAFLTRYPAAKWLQYEPAGADAARKAAEAAFPAPTVGAVNTLYRLDKADVVLTLDTGFLDLGPAGVRYARDFGKRRRVRDGEAALKAGDGVKADDMSRLYSVEAMPSTAGVLADHRLPLKPSHIEGFTRSVAKELGLAVAAPTDLPDEAQRWVKPLADDLRRARGRAVVVPGDHLSPAVHLLAHAINENLSAGVDAASPDRVVYYTQPGLPTRPLPGWPKSDQAGEFKALVGEMAAGKVSCLLLCGVNPVYDAPADLDFAEAVKKVAGPVVHHGLYPDETAAASTWHVNAAHFLESWGDVRGHDGTASLMQPLIAPLYAGRSLVELLAALLDEPESDGLAVVRKTWERLYPTFGSPQTTPFVRFWEQSVRDGVLIGTAFAPRSVAPVPLTSVDAAGFTAPAIKELEIQFRPDPTVGDGRQANNGWLQELPKPITNLTWDNAAMVSPRTAERLKVEHEFDMSGGERGNMLTDTATLDVGGRKLTAAVLAVPGMPDETVVLHLGYGRTRGGRMASPTAESASATFNQPLANPADAVSPGFNAYLLRTAATASAAAVAKMERTGKKYRLAVAGAHHAMESRRPVRHATRQQFEEDEEFAQVPPIAAGETEVIRRNTPGTPENSAAVFKWDPASGTKHPHPYAPEVRTHEHKDGTVHAEGKHHEHHVHDKRLIPLTLYEGSPQYVTNPKGERFEANRTYRRWAMAIDLGSCIGCGACTLACVAENNTPVVGKDQVTRGRAMHWIRIDRYFSIPGKDRVMEDELGGATVKEGTRKEKIKESAALRIHVQPVPCQQCEKAPCEVVCPVGATVHSADGLNDMVYNRCVGTRYCSNNCPYKVRRFNFLQFTDYTTDSLKLLNNPEVTVRTRGVMEKCTYCVQRIRNAEIEAEREWHKTKADGTPDRPRDANGRPKMLDGEVLTACQQACPTGTIMFGDLSDDGRKNLPTDPDSPPAAILRWKAEPHNYGLLAEINTMPRTSYLAAIRNPNPNMPHGA